MSCLEGNRLQMFMKAHSNMVMVCSIAFGEVEGYFLGLDGVLNRCIMIIRRDGHIDKYLFEDEELDAAWAQLTIHAEEVTDMACKYFSHETSCDVCVKPCDT